jgi:preprotein translocase subunit SecG
MFAFLMTLFVFLAIFLVLFILIQPGKGDMGLGGIGSGSQMLFGGSGGQNFFEKATWIMGAIFIFGALGLSLLRSHETSSSRLSGYTVSRVATPASVSRRGTVPFVPSPKAPMGQPVQKNAPVLPAAPAAPAAPAPIPDEEGVD